VSLNVFKRGPQKNILQTIAILPAVNTAAKGYVSSGKNARIDYKQQAQESIYTHEI
jgi:hypothetical protein